MSSRKAITHLHQLLGPQRSHQAALARPAFHTAMLALMVAGPDTLFVAASGIGYQSSPTNRFIPAKISAPNLLTVGAVDQDGHFAHFSNIGPCVALHANGCKVLRVSPGGNPLEMSGTGMAEPQVRNVAAKLLGQ